MRGIVRILTTRPIVGSVGDVALRALATIDGVTEVNVVAEDADSAVLTYIWTKPGERFDRTDEVLGRFSLRKDWEFDPLIRPN